MEPVTGETNESDRHYFKRSLREAVIYVLAEFVRYGGAPPPPPLTENQCEKKKVFLLSGIGGYPPTVDQKRGVGGHTLSHLSSRYC